MLKSVLSVIFVLLTAVVIYETGRTLIARMQTPKIFADYIASDAIKLTADNLSERQLEILLTVQDPNFFQHKGIDLETPGAGVTTITQSIVKHLYFREFKKGWRKAEQSLIARFAVHPLVSKEDQLTVFLNVTPMGRCEGNPVRGVEDAANCYYKSTLADLSEDDYVGIVAMLVGPFVYNLETAPEKHAERMRRIRNLLEGNCAPANNGDVYFQNC